MGEPTADELDDIYAFIENEDGSYPELADLPAWWDSIGPHEGDPLMPEVPARNLMLAQYLVYARTKRWARDGLDRLHKVLMERSDEIPEVLQSHINDAYHGLLKPPPSPKRSPKFSPQDDRDFRIMHVIRDLRGRRTREQAIADVAEAMRVKEGTVGSVAGKMERFWREAVKQATKRAN